MLHGKIKQSKKNHNKKQDILYNKKIDAGCAVQCALIFIFWFPSFYIWIKNFKKRTFLLSFRSLQAGSGTSTPFTRSARKRMQTEALESAAWSTTRWPPQAATFPRPNLAVKVFAPGGRPAVKSPRWLRISGWKTTVARI